MANSLRVEPVDAPRKRFAKATLRGESPRKQFAGLSLGRVIERMVALSGLSKEQAAMAMGYETPSSLSRWISEIESPSVERIWAAEWDDAKVLRTPFLMALAEHANDQIEVQTTFIVRRLA